MNPIRHAAVGETTVCGLPYLDLPTERRPTATWVLSQRAAAARDWDRDGIDCGACRARLGLQPATAPEPKQPVAPEPEPFVSRHVFDAAASAAARDDAIERVREAASDVWKAEAFSAVAHVCRMRKEFTTDDVWALLDAREVVGPREPRAMGAIMQRAVRAGLCASTDRTSKSRRVECHRRPMQVWESTVTSVEIERLGLAPTTDDAQDGRQ